MVRAHRRLGHLGNKPGHYFLWETDQQPCGRNKTNPPSFEHSCRGKSHEMSLQTPGGQLSQRKNHRWESLHYRGRDSDLLGDREGWPAAVGQVTGGDAGLSDWWTGKGEFGLLPWCSLRVRLTVCLGPTGLLVLVHLTTPDQESGQNTRQPQSRPR